MLDAFDVRARFEDPDPSVAYTAGWTRENADKNWSGTSANTGSGTAALSRTAGAQATFTFTGTGVSWIGARAPWTGIARVLLDGAFVTEVDTFAPTEQVQAVLFSATGLAAGSHTLAIEVTGAKNVAATDSLIVVDAYDATLASSAPTVARVQESDPSILAHHAVEHAPERLRHRGGIDPGCRAEESHDLMQSDHDTAARARAGGADQAAHLGREVAADAADDHHPRPVIPPPPAHGYRRRGG